MMDCAKWLGAIARGDEAAFADLYLSMRPGLLAQAQSLLAGDMAGAEDAVSEAFLDIWRRAGSFTGVGSAAGWIRRIVRNKAIDRLRKTGARECLREPEAFIGAADEGAGPEDHAVMQDDAGAIRKALEALNPDQREAVVLCYFNELPLDEISEATGAAVGTVKTRLHHARRILRAHLADCHPAIPHPKVVSRAGFEPATY